MDRPSASIQDLALRLLAAEAALPAENGEYEADRACEKLRSVLTRFAGEDAFAVLMRRSLALARADVPLLQNLKIGPNGCVDGLASIGNGTEAGAAVIANFLWLLVTFVGRPVALRLVSEAWPDVEFED